MKVSSFNEARLKKLREQYPTCRIMTATLEFVSLGENSAVLNDSYLNQVNLGNFSYVSNNSKLVNVEIGNFCSIGPYLQIGLGPHPSKLFISTYPAFYTNQNDGCPLKFRDNKIFNDTIPKTIIGHDVWIGSNVIMPGGINVGTGAIVAAGSVVVKDVPPYAVVGGNPAKVIRLRFSEEQIEFLLASEWWNWPVEKIIKNADNLSDFNKFKVIVSE